MGHPKKQRRKYETPKRPYDKVRIEREKAVKENFGLRRKKEIWRAESILRNFRRRARELLARRNEKEEKMLLETLRNMGIICENLDDVLEINLDNILSRRLQTVVYKKGLANTARHARQLVVHGNVFVSGRKVLYPSYIVKKAEEDKIILSPKIKLSGEIKTGEK
ncbi:MAG: 30S ribosomal protein S4 [Candidatus Aenigmarchaeota archaeon]|nr:30S ribosomal protein S4 [Candidatus Aenigmarchaeota archaeon]MDI6722210.1 30S ribosomal protein S4 [Candidatus Aenigmarchaeota archaeon]